ncbi:MAG: LapA family protein [Gammaproteobacteria bacterium]
MSHNIKRFFYICLFFCMLIIGLVLFLKNNQLMTFNYLIGSIEWPLSRLLFLSLCLGAVMGIAASLPLYLKLKLEKSRLEKLIQTTEKEVNNLRVMPVKDPL